jgi:hypothetical protein
MVASGVPKELGASRERNADLQQQVAKDRHEEPLS